MRKRLNAILLGGLFGFLILQIVVRGPLWRLFASERSESAAYLSEVMGIVRERYLDAGSAGYAELTGAALKGMLDGLDPHSEYLEPRSFQSMQEEIRGRFGGIGVQVESQDGRVVVVTPLAGTPGERAGILRGDEIVAINGQPLSRVAGLTEIVQQLRGAPGTSVDVGLYRPATNERLEVTLARETIRIEVVRNVRVLPDGVGYVQITEFAERTGEELQKALATLQAGGMKSLVLDLRNNPGGLLDAAVAVGSLFFPAGETIVYTQGRQPEDGEVFRSTGSKPLDVPIAVLINSGSASAAEIVAGALKDTNRAVIVGERSFGKGSVQSIFRLRDGGGLRLTTARYFTPSGKTIHEIGVAPHVEVVMTAEEDGNLRWQQSRPDISDPRAFEERFGAAPVRDRQLEVAVDILKATTTLSTRARL